MTLKDETYVTYKWLFIQAVAILSIAMGAMYFTVNSLSRVDDAIIKAKVDKDFYDRDHSILCADIDNIKQTVRDNAKELDLITKNQLLVLRFLKIQPVPDGK